MAAPRMTGTVHQLHASYGFIRDDQDVQYFFMPSFLMPSVSFGSLLPGQSVSFIPFTDPDRGRRARSIELLPRD